ncbi:50S ribosomal protein L23 [Peptoniphilus catoniae]|uniref:50S ribosomal protein L23 n=1 Tax=Peptoniphilus catoniae TaxID=1660341 RepID=UPI0010FE4F4A|nr:50S ribosomal protein L23 [Peptoniphilus catoniae]
MSNFDLIRKPIITEKSMELIEERKYTFQVEKTATKPEIKKAIEEIFGVEVESVNTMNMYGKLKRQGAHQGRRASWKKAIVKLKESSKPIEFFEGME